MTDAERSLIASHPLLLYDGVCVLCNGVVKFVVRNDKRAEFRFAPLESAVAEEFLAEATNAREGVVLVTDTLGPGQKIRHRSDAVSGVLLTLGGGWGVLGRVLAAVPRPLREFGYGIVARIRYRLFGRYAACPIPEPELRSRMVGMEGAEVPEAARLQGGDGLRR
ncbi:MAG TPA: DCC1-like thiol-disulfide oxidoreductase family protein [Edaphobacter sp.]